MEGGEEEEVEVDEEAEAEHQDENALMQSRRQAEGRPTPKEEAWRPISAAERARLVEVVRGLLGSQVTAEPSLTVLAYLEEPELHGCERGLENELTSEVSVGELRPALIRWLWAMPRQHLPRAVEVVLGIPGRTHRDPAAAQAVARRLQAEVDTADDPVLDNLLRHWSDSADIGLVEELLKLVSRDKNRAAVQRALTGLRSTGRPTKQDAEGKGQQRTLESVWRDMLLPPGDGVNWTQEHEDPDTLGVRTQLLGLQEAWPDLEQTNRRTILDAILSVLSRAKVKQQAARIAQIYNQIADPETPQTIVALRVALRKRKTTEADQQQDDTDEETRGAQSCVPREGAGSEAQKKKTKQPDKAVEEPRPTQAEPADRETRERPRPTQVDHEAATQQYLPPQQQGMRARPSSVQDYQATTQDERETEHWTRQQCREEYDRLQQEEQAEALWLAERQEELEVEAAWESYERAAGQPEGPPTHPEWDSDSD